MIEQTNKVEEELIKNEVIPILSEAIAPVISQIQRELVLVIEYTPNKPLSVKLTKKRSFAIPPEQDTNIKSEGKNVKIEISKRGKYTISAHQKAAKTGLIVSFPGGETVSDRYASNTFVNVIKRIGYEKVEKLALTCYGVPIIARKKDEFYRQEEIAPGIHVITHSSNKDKRQILEKISEMLNLGLEVEII